MSPALPTLWSSFTITKTKTIQNTKTKHHKDKANPKYKDYTKTMTNTMIRHIQWQWHVKSFLQYFTSNVKVSGHNQLWDRRVEHNLGSQFDRLWSKTGASWPHWICCGGPAEGEVVKFHQEGVLQADVHLPRLLPPRHVLLHRSPCSSGHLQTWLGQLNWFWKRHDNNNINNDINNNDDRNYQRTSNRVANVSQWN